MSTQTFRAKLFREVGTRSSNVNGNEYALFQGKVTTGKLVGERILVQVYTKQIEFLDQDDCLIEARLVDGKIFCSAQLDPITNGPANAGLSALFGKVVASASADSDVNEELAALRAAKADGSITTEQSARLKELSK